MTGKQLRNSILQWAIQGNLVPQDPNDEPASVLLERIRAEKERLIKAKKIKRDKNESVIYRGEDNTYYEKMSDGTVRCIDSEIPFDIPDSWAWCRLEQITSYIQRGKSPKYSLINQIPVVAQKCNQWSGFQIEKAQFIDPETLKSYGNERFLQNGDLMWNSTGLGTLGRMAIYWADLNHYGIAVADSHVTVIRPFSNEINSEYLYAYFSSPTVQLVIEDKADGSTKQKELSTSTVKSYLVPLPPKEEQIRIVDKILKTKPIIDGYGNLFEDFSSFNNSLKIELKKSILQEVIQGRLVPQIESEGTAEELLAEIAEEKKRLVRDGKLKKSALTTSRIFRGDDNKYHQNINGEDIIIDDFLPFEIPSTWRWISLGELVSDRTGLSYKKENLSDRTEPFIRVLRGGNIEDGELIMKADDVFISSSYVAPDLLLKKGQYISPAVSSLEKIGKTAIITKDYKDTVVGGFVLMLLPLFDDEWLGQYLYYFFQTGYYHNYCRTITKKSGQAFYNLSRPKLKLCPVPLPPKREIARIVERLNIVLASIMSR